MVCEYEIESLNRNNRNDIIPAGGKENIMAVVVDKDVCIGCGACTGVCPVGALALDNDGKSECNADNCISCLTCVGACPVSAIKEGE
ncbi:MAG: 4Fe-4S binding protein [Solobacterium sp.]|nr:4Fe-4S binding protein [Solobacterium sp.]